MPQRFKFVFVSIALLVSFVSTGVHAKVFRYTGIGFVFAQAQEVQSFTDEVSEAQQGAWETDVDGSTNGWNLWSGWQFNRFIGAEFGYSRYGGTDISALELTPAEGADARTLSVGTDARGWAAQLSLTLPVTKNVFLSSKIGQFFWSSEGHVIGLEDGALQRQSYDESGSSPILSLGAAYTFSPKLALRFELSRTELDSQNLQNVILTFLIKHE